MQELHKHQMSELVGWETFSHAHLSASKLFLLYALPMSIVPPAMLYYAGITYGGHLLPALNPMQLQSLGAVLFLAELVMTFVVAFVIQHLAA